MVSSVPLGGPTVANDTFVEAHHRLVCETSAFVSFDAEWQSDGAGRNVIVSYQLGVSHYDGGYTEMICICENGERAMLCDICGAALQVLPRHTRRLTLVTHGGAGEWAGLADRDHIVADSNRLNVIRDAPVTFKPLQVKVSMASRHTKTISLNWRDTMLMAPAGMRALKALGDFVGVPKVELPQGMIERMAELLARDPELFTRYAITDVRITLVYFCRFVVEYARLFPDVDRVPFTITGFACAGYLAFLHKENISRARLLGLRTAVRKPHKPPRRYLDRRAFTESFARDCYHGAANFAAIYGWRTGRIWDIDFSSAYATAACVIPIIDWHVDVIDDRDYELRFDGVPTLVEASFEFPESVPFPCLPVPDIDYGIIYPRKGHCRCTGIEVALARSLGAQVTVKYLVRFAPTRQRAFMPFMSMLMRERNKHPKETLPNVLLKEMGNSLYGAVGQGLGDKTVTDLRGNTKPMPPSKISCPTYAAQITGIVRAAALSVVNGIQAMHGFEVLSCTTDGVMIVVPPSADWGAFVAELRELPASALLAQGYSDAGRGDEWIELKKQGRRRGATSSTTGPSSPVSNSLRVPRAHSVC